MNLHEIKRSNLNETFNVPWTPRLVLVTDSDWNCIEADVPAGRRRFCTAYNADMRWQGHSARCITDQIAEWTRGGTSYCECRCHIEDKRKVWSPFVEPDDVAFRPELEPYRHILRLPDGDERARGAGFRSPMYGAPLPGDRYNPEFGNVFNQYWCLPCQDGEHHWTD